MLELNFIASIPFKCLLHRLYLKEKLLEQFRKNFIKSSKVNRDANLYVCGYSTNDMFFQSFLTVS